MWGRAVAAAAAEDGAAVLALLDPAPDVNSTPIMMGRDSGQLYLRAGDRVHLVDDDGLDGAERLAGPRGQEQVERLGRRDEDLGWMRGLSSPLVGRGVAQDRDDLRLLGAVGAPAAGQADDLDGSGVHAQSICSSPIASQPSPSI